MRNEHLAIVRVVRMSKVQDDVGFVSEAFSEPSDEVSDISMGLEEIHRVPLIDEHGHFLLCLVESYVPDVIFGELPNILLVYLPKK